MVFITEKTRVNISVLLLTLSSPDESSLKYEVEFLLTQKWQDPRLEYDDGGMYKFLKGRAHIDDIWIPDTYFIKHGEFKEHLVPKNMGLNIASDGTVTYTMRRQIVLTCKAGLSTFPFDNPICSFLIESKPTIQLVRNFVW
ncbi:Gamma-aminobutyric acid receptor subunit beta [Nymphon striatum]|nr:Gamma-aminobutyric acid receptor subunit beta [Nymphon striatum]